jgi:putative hemolysin
MPPLLNPDVKQKGFNSLFLILIAVVFILVDGIWFFNSQKGITGEISSKETVSENGQSVDLANPASEYCIEVGGQLQSEVRGDGGEYSLCNFPDDRSCEEWALFRKQCPVGGIKTIGFDTKEEVYCALIGGKTTAEPDADCKLPGSKICSNSDLYNGKCQ